MNSTIYANSKQDFFDRFVFKTTGGTVINVTGYTSTLRIAKYFNSTPVIAITGVIEVPATNGAFTYSATDTVMNTIEYGAHVYTRILYDSVGNTVSVYTGSFINMPTV